MGIITGTCCGFVVIIIIGYAIIQLFISSSEQRAATKARIKSNKNVLENEMHSLKRQEEIIANKVRSFFETETESYISVYDELNSLISSMLSTITQMKAINGALINDSSEEDFSDLISQAESRAINYVYHVVDGLRGFEKSVYTLPSSNMMDEKRYGKINKKYWDAVRALQRTTVVTYVSKCEKLLDSTQFDNIYALDIEEVLKCVWFFATEKTFSASDFHKAESVFSRLYKCSHADLIIANLYAKKKMGGEDVLRDPVHDLLKEEQTSQKLTLLASGLMWMNAYKIENIVLQHMLTTGKEMAAKTQERLHSLTNGGEKAPSGFDVKSSNNSFYFDVSALAWKDDEYIGLFENLAFQDKTLMYSLAVRDENKDLFIAQGINVPGINVVLNKFRTVFEEEYDSNVTVQVVKCIALSGSGEEKMDGILATSNECKQMGILIHIARIGKKLIIKFYTLFIPTSSDLAEHKQQALSMYKKLSPTVTMWESSLKDTMLMAVEQLLNAGVMADDTRKDSPQKSDVFDSDGPIF